MSLLRNRAYLCLVGSQGVSVLGSQIITIALPLLALDLTHSPAQAGFVVACSAAPFLLLSLIAGALVDRWNRRTVLVLCAAIRAAVLLYVPAAHALGVLDITQLYLVALLNGAAFAFFTIAELAVLPRLVYRAQLPRAGSINAVTESSAGLVGPGLGGALTGIGLAFGVAGTAHAVSALVLSFIRRPLGGRTSGGNVRRDIAEGLRFLWQEPTIRAIAGMSAALNLLFSPAYLAIIVLAQAELAASPAMIGVIFSVGGAAGIVGGLLAPRVTRRLTVRRALASSVVAWALAMPLVSVAPTLWVLLGGWALVTFISPFYDVTQLVYRLSLIPEGLQGRVNSSFRFIAWGLRPIAIGAGGAATAAWGARPTLWALACGMAVLACVALHIFRGGEPG